MIEAAPIVSLVLGTASSVGAVGVATLGIRALTQSFKHLRASGLSVREALDANRQIVQAHAHQVERNAMTSEQRQIEKEYEVLDSKGYDDLAWERHDELKASGFKNELPPSTGHKFL